MNLYTKGNGKFICLLLSVILILGFTDQNLPLDKEDQKKLEKASKLNQEAQEFMDKANAIYSELAQYDNADASNSKKIKKLEDEAIELQVKALYLQSEANNLERDVYLKVIPILKSEFLKDNNVPIKLSLLEEKTEELFLKAENFKNEAEQLEKDATYQKYTRLSEAQKLEKESIENQKELISYYLGEKSIEFQDQNGGNQQQEVIINEDILKSYLDYVNSQDTLVTVDDFRSLIYSDQFSASSFRDVWDSYIFTDVIYADRTDSFDINIVAESETDDVKKESISTTDKTDVLKDAIYKVQIASNKSPLAQNHLRQIYDGNKTVQMVSEGGWYKYSIGDFKTYAEAEEFKRSLKITDAFVVAYADNKKIDLQTSKEEKKTTDHQETTEILKGLIFKVQIAASRDKLSDNEIKRIYNGNESVDMIPEDNWYKYSIGSFENYEQALGLRKRTDVNGAFIVAYQNGKKIPLNIARGGVTQKKSDGGIIFKVQIAADLKPLSTDKLHTIYSGYEDIAKYEEEGWSKYSIGEFKTFEEANELRKSCNVDGAFVIAFKGNEKINVLEAKRSTRCYDPIIDENWLKNNSGLVFKVQIAASLVELKENQIKNICCIEKMVYVTQEDEWFKYSIGDFNSYGDALRLKNRINVNGAFIVSYNNSEKMNIKEAIKLSKQ